MSAEPWDYEAAHPETANSALLAQFWDALVAPGDVHEVRIPKTRRGPMQLWGVSSGYFDNRDAFVQALTPITGDDAEGAYLTLNPVNPALLARANNRLLRGKPITTADADVRRLRNLLIDIDPIRPAGISATADEVKAAIAVRDIIRCFLRDEAGWPHAVAVTRTGNGGGLLYRLELPNDAAHTDLLRRVLVALDTLSATSTVAIDTSTFNASRMTKVIGSIAAKGENLPERPWRRATGRFNIHPVHPVSIELLEAVAGLIPTTHPHQHTRRPDAEPGRDWDIRDRLQAAGISFTEVEKGYGTIFRLERCLTSEEHVDGACLIEFPSGALA
jgi:hypothetical protein